MDIFSPTIVSNLSRKLAEKIDLLIGEVLADNGINIADTERISEELKFKETKSGDRILYHLDKPLLFLPKPEFIAESYSNKGWFSCTQQFVKLY